jgi:hypothetical protein
VLLPKRWVVERSFAWTARFRRLDKDYERLPEVLRGLHFQIFAILMLPKAIPLLTATENAWHSLASAPVAAGRPFLRSARVIIVEGVGDWQAANAAISFLAA